ncbi:MAG: DUF4304 domain-containing protein [Hyphomicrobium sp.]|nr:DUF4304 domain-containing protein [Hyphomicrobium sp.]
MELGEGIAKILAPGFRSLGFRGAGRHYRRDREYFVDCINVQQVKQNGQVKFCINLGVVPLFAVPSIEETSRLMEVRCWFRKRLSPSRRDYWINSTNAQAADYEAVFKTFGRYGLDFFAAFEFLEDIYGKISPRNIDARREKLNAFCSTSQPHEFRLEAARAAVALGDIERAKALATFAAFSTANATWAERERSAEAQRLLADILLHSKGG